ncbi:glycosyltransferase [bacterium]|nr:glycosyltransferase [bacterium]MDC0288492.1 glycosyltransferase [Rubripirellula sp.]
MKFLFPTTFYPPYSFGGDAVFLERLALALTAEGHEVDVVHCVDAYHSLQSKVPQSEPKSHPNLTVHSLRSGFGILSPLLTHQTGNAWFKSKPINELIQKKNFDVIHFHNPSLLGLQSLELALHAEEAVVLYTAHEHWLICPIHVLWKNNRRPCEKPACIRCSLIAGRPPQLWRYTSKRKQASKHVDRFIAPSRFTARLHRERGFEESMTHLPNFVDRVDNDWQSPEPSPHPRPYFLFVGRLEPIKGAQTLIESWNHISDIDLVIAGSGSSQKSLEELAGNSPRIRFVGQIPEDELGAYYVNAIGCIIPSITHEVFPLVIIESFARKTPVIVRDLGALPEAVHDSSGGFIYSNHEELVEAIEQLRQSQSQRQQFGERGYQYFLEHWSREAHLSKYMALIGEVRQEKFGTQSGPQ